MRCLAQPLKQRRDILLVDDEENLTQILALLLETRGYHVKVAATGQEALSIVSPEIDLIILDLILPDVNGFEVCRQLKKRKDCTHIPIIMLSAHAMQEDRVEGLYLGADDFISKPCEQEELVARMEAVMRRRYVRRQSLLTIDDEIICELRRILDEAALIPHFQPIYQLKPFRLFGLEVLTRPQSYSLADPEVFFKTALKFGLYGEMESLSWSLALEKLSQRTFAEKIFLNCNPYLIESQQFFHVREIFENNQIDPRQVALEMTERSSIINFKLFLRHLKTYRDFGIDVVIDDLGGGYASLESIVELHPEIVKIDRHIVKNLCEDGYKRSVVKFIVAFCREQGIMTIAEGVESRCELKAIQELGVDAAQGYYLYRPTAHLDMERFQALRH